MIWLYGWFPYGSVSEYVASWLAAIFLIGSVYALAYICGWISAGWRALRRRA